MNKCEQMVLDKKQKIIDFFKKINVAYYTIEEGYSENDLCSVSGTSHNGIKVSWRYHDDDIDDDMRVSFID